MSKRSRCRARALLAIIRLLIAGLVAAGLGTVSAEAATTMTRTTVAGPGDDCINCNVSSNSQGTHGRMLLLYDGRHGLRKFLGSDGCAGCKWRVVLKCPWGNPLQPCRTERPFTNPCTTSDGKPGQFYVSSFSPDGINWSPVNGNLCIPDEAKVVTLEAVLGGVRVLVDQLVPPAGVLQHQPAGYALVRLPLLMRTDTQQVPAKTFFASAAGAPFRVLIKVTPFAWHWKVDGAEVRSTDFPGRSYEPGRSPRLEPSYYASHTFAETGAHQLSVTIDWSATATIPGIGTFDVDGFTPRTSSTVPIAVKQARSQLERG